MWRSLSLLLLFSFVISGCTIYDIETFEITINPGIDTVQVNSSFEDAGATATIEGHQRRVVVIENTVDITKVGTYVIVYQASYRNTFIRATRIVDVVDEIPPQITLRPGIDTILVGETWEDAGVMVTDNSKEDVHLMTSGTVNTEVAGEYIITYTAEDSSGNISEVQRYVNVIEENSDD